MRRSILSWFQVVVSVKSVSFTEDCDHDGPFCSSLAAQFFSLFFSGFGNYTGKSTKQKARPQKRTSSRGAEGSGREGSQGRGGEARCGDNCEGRERKANALIAKEAAAASLVERARAHLVGDFDHSLVDRYGYVPAPHKSWRKEKKGRYRQTWSEEGQVYRLWWFIPEEDEIVEAPFVAAQPPCAVRQRARRGQPHSG